jgi:hypothetical protein
MEIKSPWTMVYSEFIDEFISLIKENLPPTHELQTHDLYPGIKVTEKPIFIVDDDTTGKRVLIDCINKKRWGKNNQKVATIRLFENDEEIQEMINQDHRQEFSR